MRAIEVKSPGFPHHTFLVTQWTPEGIPARVECAEKYLRGSFGEAAMNFHLALWLCRYRMVREIRLLRFLMPKFPFVVRMQ